jgi:conjugal transfer pilus assembly protein TraB
MAGSIKSVERKQWLVGIGLTVSFLFLLIFGMWISDPNKGKPSPRQVAAAEARQVRTNYASSRASVISAEEQWIAKSEQELAEYKSENRALKQDLQSLINRTNDLEQLLKLQMAGSTALLPPAGVSPVMTSTATLPPPNYNRASLALPGVQSTPVGGNVGGTIAANILPAPVRSPGNATANNTADGAAGSAIQVFLFDDENGNSANKAKANNISHYIPSGSFGKIVLLSGVDAPTGGEADSNPVPILMRLIDHGTLPNYFQSDIRDCHVTGSVRGDLSSERGKIRTEKLSCVLIGGDVVEVNIKGWINGEDGKEGFRGTVVEKAGALLARTFVAGTFSGFGSFIASQSQSISETVLGNVSSINPQDAGKYGLATGVSSSFEKLSDYYMKRANEMYPIIEISANRIGELVLQEGIDLKSNIINNMGRRL